MEVSQGREGENHKVLVRSESRNSSFFYRQSGWQSHKGLGLKGGSPPDPIPTINDDDKIVVEDLSEKSCDQETGIKSLVTR